VDLLKFIETHENATVTHRAVAICTRL